MIGYRMQIADAHAHLVEVEVEAEPTGATTRFALPAWSPGSYLVRDYARHVRAVQADAPVRKLDKQTWSVDSEGAGSVRLRYQVYAHELTVRTSHVDGRHAFLHGPSLLMYVPERLREPAQLELSAPAGWQVLTALPGDGRLFHADDYDHLIDAPIELSPALVRVGFDAAERPHEIAICGLGDGPIDGPGLARDVSAIVGCAADLFGGLPYERYLFLLHLAPAPQPGGLEHRNSAALLAAPGSFRPRKKYEELLELFAHEHFHAWNVKRIRPAALGPFDYTRESYTRALWVMEGVTSYYDRHLLVRAGLLPAQRYLDKLGEELARLRQIPGRLVQSLEEASFDAWIKFYKPDEATPNSTVSYYLKGGLTAVALDLTVRSASGGTRSLDDGMRLLWQRYGRAARGFDDDDVQALLEEATGVALGSFFDAYVRGRTELDLERVLATAGLKVEPPAPSEPAEPEAGYLGVQTREIGSGRSQVAVTLAAGPAERAGLYPGDELVALDGLRVDERTLRDRLATRRPGERVRLHLLRRDELVELEVELGRRPPDALTVKPDPAAPAPARALYQAWLGAPFPT
ncbi:MAG TPA: PDZ domain-containing protein [Polyangia bacterium]|nr:PDZ domain-containing protein [Polyangia bacterium]